MDDVLGSVSSLEKKAYSPTPALKAKMKNIPPCKHIHELTYWTQNKLFNQVRQHKVASAKRRLDINYNWADKHQIENLGAKY